MKGTRPELKEEGRIQRIRACIWCRTTHLSDSVATPSGLEAVPFPLHLDVCALAVHGERRAQVVEGHQQVKAGLGLRRKKNNHNYHNDYKKKRVTV